MTRSFFQSLERCAVSYLLISGQATVLYGAAAFSEDIDLWIEPSQNNIDQLMAALRSVKAQFYKLTPEMNHDSMEKGHGFHFLIPDEQPVYIDVMGRPPRVGPFAQAKKNSLSFETEWGRIPVIGLQDLVEIKKTQRIEDYAIISRLAVEWLKRPECAKTDADLRWAAENVFTLEQFELLAKDWGEKLEPLVEPELRAVASRLHSQRDTSADVEEQAVKRMQSRMHALQQSDRSYWRDIIADLRSLRAENRLMTVGRSV